ncbi:Mu transposase C-terminal domain-containing protein [Chitinibacteraceae bacterium HSL-7]
MNSRGRLVPGVTVQWRNGSHVILDLANLKQAVVRDMATGETLLAPVSELEPTEPNQAFARQDLMLVDDADWKEAWARYELIVPLLEAGTTKRAELIRQVAEAANRNVATIYRWLQRYEETGRVSSLLRSNRQDKGGRRLPVETEKLIDEVITNFHLTKQRRPVSETCLEVVRLCRERNLREPHPNTVRNRIALISEKQLMSKRLGHKAARERFQPIRGEFPGADFPLAVVQIDHTPVDLILVDDVHRMPIGRPYLTIAIDVYSRMIVGFYVTLDHPGALSAGLCIARAIMRKDMWLAKMELSTPWPIWGKMRKIHVDNAKEFRGVMLERACNEHGIVLEFRPKGQPNYGGHVERAFGTFMQQSHTVSGTTFSNVSDRGDYGSDAAASMTLDEFERWFTVFVVEVYHQRAHKGISNVPPIKLYEQAILGTPERPGIGLPQPVADEERLQLDFLPYVERTIQEYGVLIDNIHYYADVLRPWIHARDEANAKLKRRFIFARDPRDISVVYFLDPSTRSYAAIPYRDSSRPAISLWELRAAVKRLEENDLTQPNEDLIFAGIRRMREIESNAIGTTKAAKQARRNEQRRHQTRKVQPKRILESPLLQTIDEMDAYPGSNAQPFDDIAEAE